MPAKPKQALPKLSRAASRIAKRKADYSLEDRLVPIDVVIQIAGLGKTMIYKKAKLGSFPKPCHPGGASSRWSEAEVREWKRQVMAERDAA